MGKVKWTQIRTCNRCGKQYTASWMRQQYCDDCRDLYKREGLQIRNRNRPRRYRKGEKEAERRDYIREKLRVIADFHIKRPDKAVLDRFYDLTVSDGEIDRYFRRLIDEKLGVR